MTFSSISNLITGKMNLCFKKKTQARDQIFFIENGGKLLEELVASSNGRCNPIRIYSSEELERATNNYSLTQLVTEDSALQLYRGYQQDREISVKKYQTETKEMLDLAITDIVTSSQMAVHKNVLRLKGCCLDSKIPTLLYEFVGERTLYDCIYDSKGMRSKPWTWINRLRIAMDIASAVAYLHTAFSRPIIHRDIRSKTIIVDENYIAKLVDFSLCISIPEGQTHIEATSIAGAIGLMAPEYVIKRYLTEKVDTYSFGCVLLMILTGQKLCDSQLKDEDPFLLSRAKHAAEINQLGQIIDPRILDEGIQQEQLQTFATLALSCVREEVADRPMMIDVARELRQIYLFALPTS